MPKEPRFTVFEAINDKRKEIFVGITSDQIFETITKIQSYRPPAIKHWDRDDAVTIRSIEFDLDENNARTFLQQYLKRSVPPGWRYFTGKVPDHAE